MSDRDPRAPGGRDRVTSGVQVGRVLGVPVIIQPIWFALVVVLAIGFAPVVRQQVPGIAAGPSYAVAVVFVLLLYASVFVHEVSHLVIARALGMQVHRLVIQLFGGVTEIEEERPGEPGREYLVAAVGPLTSVLLGGVGLALLPAFDHGSVPRLLAESFALLNLTVAAFNALPGLPLDGGRVLRAVVWGVTRDKVRGTVIAAWVGRVIAGGLVLVAIAQPGGFGDTTFASFYLVLLAFYLWSAATLAIGQAKFTNAVPHLDVRALARRAMPVTAELPVAEAVRRAREQNARALVVVDGLGRPSGLVSEAAVVATPPQRQPWVSVSDLARPLDESLVLTTDMSGEALVLAVQSSPASEYLVLDQRGTIWGVLARADLAAALHAAGLR